MKILVATPVYPPEIGHPGSYVRELAIKLSHNNSVTIVAYTDVTNAPPGVILVHVSKKLNKILRIIKYFFAVWKNSKDVDVMYVQNAVAAGLPTALVGIIRKIPVVVNFFADEAWEGASRIHLTEKSPEEFLKGQKHSTRIKMFIAIQNFVLQRAKLITTPSRYLSEQITAVYDTDPKKIVVNYLPPETLEILPFEIKRDHSKILVDADWSGTTDIENILKTFVILKEKSPEIKMTVLGDEQDQSVYNNTKFPVAFKSDIVFIKNCSKTEMLRHIKSAYVYVIYSTRETIPYAALRSLAAETPTIVTIETTSSEIIDSDKNGLVVKSGESKELALAIESVLHNQELREKMISEGKNLMKTKFSWNTHITNLQEILRKIKVSLSYTIQ